MSNDADQKPEWRWEMVVHARGDTGLMQTSNYYTEYYAKRELSGYTKVPGSEREI